MNYAKTTTLRHAKLNGWLTVDLRLSSTGYLCFFTRNK
jgi:hypothetical protein